jgi:hypothetical protein
VKACPICLLQFRFDQVSAAPSCLRGVRVLLYGALWEKRRCSADCGNRQADRVDRCRARRVVRCNHIRLSGYVPIFRCAVRSIYTTASCRIRGTCLGGWVDCRGFHKPGRLGWSLISVNTSPPTHHRVPLRRGTGACEVGCTR